MVLITIYHMCTSNWNVSISDRHALANCLFLGAKKHININMYIYNWIQTPTSYTSLCVRLSFIPHLFTLPMESSTANEQVPAQPVAVQIAPEAPNREIKVFSPPANAPLPAEMPESFYKLDANDIGKLYKSQMDNRQKIENAPLRTQKMRTTEEQERMKKYPRATIRVRLPDGTILQAVFESKEKVSALYSFIRTTLETPDRQFLLCLPPRTKLVDPDLSLFKANLAPASNVMFVWIEKATGSGKQYKCWVSWRS
ncbi:hypothetical protein CLU79DRAFT_775447 [Phycomyces nitens]|nr:hypothetical protein CLU79DRAFT_775447 [Phycomyces nitens]